MKISIRKTKYFFLVIYVILMSGSFFGLSYSNVLSKINIVVVGIGFLYLLIKGKFEFRRDLITLFLMITVFTYITRMIMWNELSSITGYIGDLAIVFSYVLLARYVDYNLFIDQYIKIMLAMSIGALLGMRFFNVLISMPVPIIRGDWNYHYFGIFALREVSDTRTVGLFWEPGMFQGYLIFAMLLIALKPKRSMKEWIYFFIFGATVVTTRSTTGFFLLIVLVAMIVVLAINPKGANGSIQRIIIQWLIVIVTCVAAVTIIVSPEIFAGLLSYFPEDVVGKLTDTSNVSTNTRTYGMVYDLFMAFQHPLGVGRNSVSEIRNGLMKYYGVVVTGRTSSWTTAFVYSGVLGGILYVYLWIKGSLNFNEGNVIKGIFTIIILTVIANTEPHYGSLFFNMIVIMWFLRKNNSSEVIDYR